MINDKLIVRKLPGTADSPVVLQLAGPITLVNLFDLQAAVREDTSQALILDMTGVPVVDSAGIGLLVNAHVSRTNSGRRLALAGVAERIKTILTVTGVYAVFSVFPTVDGARESLRQPANS